MKFWQYFFQMLKEYQQIKYTLKCNYETHKLNCSLRYMEKQKELCTK